MSNCTPSPVGSSSDEAMPEVAHTLTFSTEDTNMVRGFQEVIFSVSDIEEATQLYQNIGGWQVVYRSGGTKEQLNYWQVDTAARLTEVVLANPGDERGYLRLVQFDGVSQRPIRSSGRTWDTGGIFDINIRAKDLPSSFEALQDAGWNGFSDPIRYQFGPFDVSEVILQGPDGIALALMERHAPPLEGYPNLRKLSHIFNSTHISKDAEAAHAFFIDQLGWEIYLQTPGLDRTAGPNVLGFPQNINAEIELPVYIVHPQGINFGSIEFIEVKGLDGEDFSAYAQPPNLGILLLRFPVKNANAYADILQSRGVELYQPVTTLNIAPYGLCRLFSVRSPDGVLLEFVELKNSYR